MKIFEYLKDKLLGLSISMRRYPVSTLFLGIIAVMVGMEIQGTTIELTNYINTGVVLVVATAAAQNAYERFFLQRGPRMRLGTSLVALLVGVLHYFSIYQLPKYSIESDSRTIILSAALAVLFIWLPVIKHRNTFEQSLMANFKNFFQAVLYGGVLMLGVAAIIGAVDQLLFTVGYRLYSYAADLIFVLFTPIFFLSLAPFFNQEGQELQEQSEAELQQKISSPKVLEILLSYIIIPLTAVFTLILVLYLILNVRGEFWTDNLLEPMLVSYSAVVILLTLLTMHIENRFTKLFRQWAPKVLIPIVMFQLIASILALQQSAMTPGRYFVILYGVFAILAGITLSISNWQRKGIVAALLVFFLVLSITPPIDAFTISRSSNIKHLESTLTKYDMLQNNQVVITSNVSKEDQKKITDSIQYLGQMENLDRLSWLPKSFALYQNEDYIRVFGFPLYDNEQSGPNGNRWFLSLNQNMEIPLQGYQYLVKGLIAEDGQIDSPLRREFSINGQKYVVRQTVDDQGQAIQLVSEQEEVLAAFHTKDLYTRMKDRLPTKGEMTLEEATFVSETGQGKMTIIFDSVDILKNAEEIKISGYAFFFVAIP